MKILRLFSKLYWHYFASCEKEARHLGVNIGNHCLIETREWSSEPYLISIGDHVQVTGFVSFYTHGGCNCIRHIHPNFETFGKITIEDWAYIGSHSCIMPGVTIGKGALVAAGSVVTKSVPPHTVVGGNPAKIICSTEEFYQNNKKYNLNKRLSKIEKKKILPTLPEDMFVHK